MINNIMTTNSYPLKQNYITQLVESFNKLNRSRMEVKNYTASDVVQLIFNFSKIHVDDFLVLQAILECEFKPTRSTVAEISKALGCDTQFIYASIARLIDTIPELATLSIIPSWLT